MLSIKEYKSLKFVCVPAEVSCQYGLMLNELIKGSVLFLGCTNGMEGYLPTPEECIEGGMEVRTKFYDCRK